ncbi:MAG: hypothetical protein AAAC48_25580 [Phyllobacterium sp.]|uniref:hypothetical protein n=1 Tax=Phyllobacterium sp. TaxID=1871046 RepID=UPI0030F09815
MTADFGAVSIPMTLSRSDKIDKDIWKKYLRQTFSALALMAAIAEPLRNRLSAVATSHPVPSR